MDLSKSKELFNQAKKYIPGGVNSPVRAYSSVNMDPPFIKKGEGAYIYDEDGNKYIDYVGSWGPLILGHCRREIIDGIKKVVETGTSYGAPTEIESKMAKLIVDEIESIDMVRMVNSGTEATMSALRLARGYTGRSKIVKFNGNYHGHSDSFLIKAGSGLMTHGVPNSPGVTADVIKDTIIAEYNDVEEIEEIFLQHGENIAGVIVEPVAGNMGVVPMSEEFGKKLRSLTSQYGSLLIFDEVMTGFRLSFKGAQSLYGIKPDLTCYSKIIGGGLPVGAFGGRREIMEKMAPIGPVYQAGTLSGNPLAMTAGYTTLKILRDNPDIYEKIDRLGEKLEKGLKEQVKELGIKASFNRVASMLCMFFTDEEVVDFKTADKSDRYKYEVYFKGMLKRGIYLAPSQFEATFINYAMTDEDIEETLKASYEALREVSRI